jgi:hypothetical protein
VTYGGGSGNRIFVLYWRCSLIRVSVIRGPTVYAVRIRVLCCRSAMGSKIYFLLKVLSGPLF